MKLSNLTAKLTCMKSNAFRTLAAGTVAVAALTLAAPAANAQHWAVSAQIGPQYGYVQTPAPAYGYYNSGYYNNGYAYGNGYYDRDAWRDHERHEAWERHEAMERAERERAYARQRYFDHERHEAYEHGYRGW